MDVRQQLAQARVKCTVKLYSLVSLVASAHIPLLGHTQAPGKQGKLTSSKMNSLAMSTMYAPFTTPRNTKQPRFSNG
eukprot:2968038-Amphidinium_carterae.1